MSCTVRQTFIEISLSRYQWVNISHKPYKEVQRLFWCHRPIWVFASFSTLLAESTDWFTISIVLSSGSTHTIFSVVIIFAKSVRYITFQPWSRILRLQRLLFWYSEGGWHFLTSYVQGVMSCLGCCTGGFVCDCEHVFLSNLHTLANPRCFLTLMVVVG